MHRFHLPPDQCQRDDLTLTGQEAHHAQRVLRLRTQAPVVVLDGAGGEYHGHITALERQSVRIHVDQRRSVPPPACALTLVQAVPKAKIFDAIIQKATELGVHRIVPLLSSRVVVQLDGAQYEHKLAHWRATALEAIKQCGFTWLPQLAPPVTPAEFLDQREQFDLTLFASLRPGARAPRELFEALRARPDFPPRSVCIWVGPEGDFTPEESDLIQASGAEPITLGPLILRVETAALYCLSFLHYELQAPAAS
jgi:16S rRNA (uracil1498-N3)-methyltransferase